MKWIALRQPHTWLYSTDAERKITIQCDELSEKEEIIKNTGKITLKGECKLTTADMTIQTKKTIYRVDTETFLPGINITVSNTTLTYDNETLKNISQHGTELARLKANLETIDKNLQNSEQNFFTTKQFVYPMATSGIITLIIIGIIIWIVIQRKNRYKVRRPIIKIIEDEHKIPRSNLKRSDSTRF